MKKFLTLSLVAAATTTMAFGSTAADIADLQAQIDKLKTKQGKINAQSANDNIKWGVDFRTAIDSINYDMANGDSHSNDSLMSMRLWLNMAYAPDSHNIFKGQLSMNKAFGADFDPTMSGQRSFGTGSLFDWTTNEALTDSTLRVRQAYWLYLGDKAFGADIPWSFSIGRRPATNGFLASLSQDDTAQSPLGHVINVEFDGLSSKLDFSNITGVPGLSFKLCLGRGSTNASPLFSSATTYAEDNSNGDLDGVDLGGFIFEPYNDGQYIVKTTWFRAFNLPDAINPMDMQQGFKTVGDIDGAGISVLVDGVTEEGYFSDVKLFGSFAWTESNPDAGQSMFGTTQANAFAPLDPSGMQPSTVTFGAEPDESQSGTSYWFGAYLPVSDGEGENYGTVGLEYNHGSQYWRPFTYAEDTMIGSKIAARGDAYELNYTYQITDALSFQARYINIDYDYTGSNGFFGDTTGVAMDIDDVKANAAQSAAFLTGPASMDPTAPPTLATLNAMNSAGMLGPDGDTLVANAENQANMAVGMASQIVESAQDFRFYLRYRF